MYVGALAPAASSLPPPPTWTPESPDQSNSILDSSANTDPRARPDLRPSASHRLPEPTADQPPPADCVTALAGSPPRAKFCAPSPAKLTGAGSDPAPAPGTHSAPRYQEGMLSLKALCSSSSSTSNNNTDTKASNNISDPRSLAVQTPADTGPVRPIGGLARPRLKRSTPWDGAAPVTVSTPPSRPADPGSGCKPITSVINAYVATVPNPSPTATVAPAPGSTSSSVQAAGQERRKLIRL
jgi:hypothetical protein